MRLENLNIGDQGFRYQGAKGTKQLFDPVLRAAATVALWRRRSRERAEFAVLGPFLKRDLGITDADIWQETGKWFWQS